MVRSRHSSRIPRRREKSFGWDWTTEGVPVSNFTLCISCKGKLGKDKAVAVKEDSVRAFLEDADRAGLLQQLLVSYYL